MIHEEIVTYEVAKLAKQKGFDEATYYTYDEESKQLNRMRHCVKRNSRIGSIIKLIAAPTQSLLQRWLREERGIIVEVFMDDDSNMPLTYNIHQYKDWNWERESLYEQLALMRAYCNIVNQRYYRHTQPTPCCCGCAE